jgi:hypothetical protein
MMTQLDLFEDTEPATKTCGCCSLTLSLAMFAKNIAKKDGLQERCKTCRAAHHQKTKHTRTKPTTEQKRKHLLSHKYKLTPEEFSLMLGEQEGKCAICFTFDWGHTSPSVDHCHVTGKIRGLLCNNCNRGLGLFKDNKELLENAAKYLV